MEQWPFATRGFSWPWYFIGGDIDRHLLGWFAYVGLGVLIVINGVSLPSFKVAALATTALTTVIALHLISMIAVLRR